jgi:hypothetical protein
MTDAPFLRPERVDPTSRPLPDTRDTSEPDELLWPPPADLFPGYQYPDEPPGRER